MQTAHQASDAASSGTPEHEGVLVKIFSDKDYEQEAFEKANLSAGHGFELQHLRVCLFRSPVIHTTLPNTRDFVQRNGFID